MPLGRFATTEARFAMLARSDPEQFASLMRLAEQDISERWRYYEELAGLDRTAPELPPRPQPPAGATPEEG
jgi:pyruvate-ferredoxin/flavodoxin oxidoreductase